MSRPTCATCGTQFDHDLVADGRCPICEDERQYVPPGGQRWTSVESLRESHRVEVREEEAGLLGLTMVPRAGGEDGAGGDVGLGQRAFVVRTAEGNVMFDCLPTVDEDVVERIEALGGLATIAVSHPHFYGAMVEWSEALGGVPIVLHEGDRKWLPRRSAAVQYWRGTTRALPGGPTLVSTRGHFDGHQLLHWTAGAEGRGVLLSADQPYVARNGGAVSFMYSFPNLIPLSADSVRTITTRLEPLAYDRIYGAFPGQVLAQDAAAVVDRSAARYIQSVERAVGA